jgi:hypothetical protein
VPEGRAAQLPEYPRAQVLDAVDDATRQALAAFGDGAPALAFAFTCTSRKGVLGTWTDRECQRVRALLPPDVPVAGFYTFGELAGARVHNGTIVMLLVGGS